MYIGRGISFLGHEALRVPLYRIPLLLREDEIDTLVEALKYADKPDFTKGNIKIKNKLAYLVSLILTEYHIKKIKHDRG